MGMQAEERVARQRLSVLQLSVLQLAEVLTSVSAACRQRGMTRTQFYDDKRRFELQGVEDVEDMILPKSWLFLAFGAHCALDIRTWERSG